MILRQWVDGIDAALSRGGLPMGITGGETFADGRAVFNTPALDTPWTAALARALGVARVSVRLQVEVCPFVVVVHQDRQGCEERG